MAVIDGSQIKDGDKTSDICSYLLLESEIKGYIENPFSYFDTSNVERKECLDNLLLTQGWRNYVWKRIVDSTFVLRFPAENGLTVSGKVRHKFVDRPLMNVNVSLALTDKNDYEFQHSISDSAGRYYFNNLNFTGSRNLIITASGKRNEPIGWVIADTIMHTPALVKEEEYKIWLKNYKKEEVLTTYGQTVELNNTILKEYKLADTVMLNEIVVKARKVLPDLDSRQLYGNPDKTIVVNPSWHYGNVFEILAYRSGGSSGLSNPTFYLDGYQVDPSSLEFIPPSQIERIELVKNGYGVISVYTRKNFKVMPYPIIQL